MAYSPDNSQQNSLPGVEVANHSNRGLPLEKRIVAAGSEYEARHWAQIDRNPSAWEFISDKRYLEMKSQGKLSLIAECGDGRKMMRVATNVDFTVSAKGKLLKLGVPIKFDAKMCKGDSIPLDNFKLHQVNNLITAERCGAIAGFLIQFWGRVEKQKDKTIVELPDLFFFCPPRLVRDYFDRRAIRGRARSGEGAISTAVLKEKGIEISCRGNFLDWLPPLIPHAFKKELYEDYKED